MFLYLLNIHLAKHLDVVYFPVIDFHNFSNFSPLTVKNQACLYIDHLNIGLVHISSGLLYIGFFVILDQFIYR